MIQLISIFTHMISVLSTTANIVKSLMQNVVALLLVGELWNVEAEDEKL